MSRQHEAPSDLASEAAHTFAEGEEAPPPGVRTMAVLRWILVALMAVAAAASLWYAFASARHETAAGEASVYYCPMHPSVVQDHPGECPICGMTLVPGKPDSTAHETGGGAASVAAVTSAHAHTASPDSSAPAPDHANAPLALSALDLPAERVQLLGMRTARVMRGALPAALRTVGYVVPTESGLASVQVRYSGWIQELQARETGQLVKRGQLLARIYSPELLAAQQELLNAKRWSAEPARATEHGGVPVVSLLTSARSRLSLLGMDAQEIAEIERSGAPHRLIEVRSPATGYVVQKSALDGLYVQPGNQLFQIADLSRVWVIAEIFERDAALIQVGQRATLTLAAYPGQTFAGRVQFLYPTIDPNTRTLRARVEFKNPELRLRPGMFGDMQLELSATSGLTIPREAVVDTGEHQYVFVTMDRGHFEPRVIQLGARDEERVQVLSGLSEGETVVTTGNFLLDSESRLQAAIAGHSHAGH